MEIRKDIVITGFAGSPGAAFITERRYDQLIDRFRTELLDSVIVNAKNTCIHIAKEPEDCIIAPDRTDPESPGILTRLYELSEKERCGLCIELKKIPIRQMTVEICELYGLNPYRIPDDCSIVLTPPGEGAGRAVELEKQGLPAALIGYMTDCRAKIVTDKTNIEYINRA